MPAAAAAGRWIGQVEASDGRVRAYDYIHRERERVSPNSKGCRREAEGDAEEGSKKNGIPDWLTVQLLLAKVCSHPACSFPPDLTDLTDLNMIY